jgi:hypothetical protein
MNDRLNELLVRQQQRELTRRAKATHGLARDTGRWARRRRRDAAPCLP